MDDKLPAHIEAIIENTDEVDRLLEIHEQLGGTGVGRRHHIEVINRSAIVMLVACWEDYVENLATIAFDYLIENVESARDLPRKLQAYVARSITAEKDDCAVWKLADTGWKAVLREYRSEILERHTGRFNTPRTAKVDSLYESLIGLQNLSKSWKWSGTSNESAKKRLEELITLRGEIAHRVIAGRSVRKKDVLSDKHLIGFISATSSNRVAEYLEEVTGTQPFIQVQYVRKG